MKQIYLLIECYGEYEDYVESVVKAYESEKDALIAKGKYMAKAFEEFGSKVYKCMDCPIHHRKPNESDAELMSRAKAYCSEYNSDYIYSASTCINEEPYEGELRYYIQSVELVGEVKS